MIHRCYFCKHELSPLKSGCRGCDQHPEIVRHYYDEDKLASISFIVKLKDDMYSIYYDVRGYGGQVDEVFISEEMHNAGMTGGGMIFRFDEMSFTPENAADKLKTYLTFL